MRFFYIQKKYIDGLQELILRKIPENLEVTVNDISKKISCISRAHVLRIFQELEQKDILHRCGKIGKQHKYKINKNAIEK